MTSFVLLLALGAPPATADDDARAALALATARRNRPVAVPVVPEPGDVWDYTGDLPPYPAPSGQEWKRYSGKPWALFPLSTQSAPEVASPVQTGGTFRDGHQCPKCGRSQYVVESFNRNGTHNHRCAVDGTVWSH